MIYILNWNDFEQNIWNWVHENPDDIQQIKNRAMIVAGSPVFIGVAIGLILITIMQIGGR